MFMKIDKNNYKEIGTGLRCHDSRVSRFEYDFNTRGLQLVFSASAFSNVERVTFEDVVCYRVTGLEPWGHDDTLFDWQYIEPERARTAYHDIIEQISKNDSEMLKNMVFSEFVFKSGDTIFIACRSILAE